MVIWAKSRSQGKCGNGRHAILKGQQEAHHVGKHEAGEGTAILKWISISE